MAAHKWEKHTINLIYGSDLDMKFKISPNKSHMVRHVFQRANELRMEVLNLIDENQQMKENIAKLQARLSGDRTDDDVIREMRLETGQTFFESYAPDWIPKEEEEWFVIIVKDRKRNIILIKLFVDVKKNDLWSNFERYNGEVPLDWISSNGIH